MSWTRPISLDDVHTLLELVVAGQPVVAWTRAVDAALSAHSRAHRRELVRAVRQHFLTEERGRLKPDLFLTTYQRAPATAQLQLVSYQWALSHPMSLAATAQLVAPALHRDPPVISSEALDRFLSEQLGDGPAAALHKTRAVLLSALKSVGTLTHRSVTPPASLHARRAEPRPESFAYLLARQLAEEGRVRLSREEACSDSLPVRLTLCTLDHAQQTLERAVAMGLLVASQTTVAPAPP